MIGKGGRVVLVELALVEQRLAVVKEVLDGVTVPDVARRYWGWRGKRCTRGCVGTPGAGWPG